MTNDDILKLAQWSKPREVQTKYGPRILRQAAVSPEFTAAWRDPARKAEIKAVGAGFGKNQAGEWELTWWAQLDTAEVEARAASVAASKATAADIELPHPAGLDYMPFQKAGIKFGLGRKGVLIADEMGLGKTIQAIGIINADPTVKRVVVVCPKTLKLNWHREITKWLTRPALVIICSGKPVLQLVDCLSSPDPLYDEIRRYGSEKGDNIDGAANSPLPLGFYSLDTAIGNQLALMAGEPAEAAQVVNQGLTGIGYSDLPTPATGADPTFTVDYPGNIGEISNGLRDDHARSLAGIADKRVPGDALEVVSNSSIPQMQPVGNVLNTLPLLQQLEGFKQLRIGHTGGTGYPVIILIMTYELLNAWQPVTSIITYDCLICDDAHLIKNSKTQRSKNVKGIKALRNLRLTGTPIVNRPAELYNIIEDLCDGWGTFFTFAKRYCAASHGSFGWDMRGASNLDELQLRLREKIMVRRLKMDVLTELPRKIRQVIELEPVTAAQRACVAGESKYEEGAADRTLALRAAVELAKAESQEAYEVAVGNLREATQVDFTKMSRLRHETALAKVPLIIEHIEACLADDDDKKLIVAGHHIDVIEELRAACAAAGLGVVVLTGAQNDVERQAAVDAFQTDPRVRVFIGGIMAAGVGITLTAASHVIFAELDWVPGNVTQFEDRAHRIGQTETVLVQHLVLAGSIDARMAQTIVGKQAVIDQALDVNHPARAAVVYEPKAQAATANVTPAALAVIEVSEAQAAAINVGLRILNGYDVDHAQARNGMGLNKLDTAIGHSLAERAYLTPKQLALARKLIMRYHKQLPEQLVLALGD